jgi:cellulose synthase/poly-beta-1,6-N-acetylglucosamine synthase-like glycosyltransferase
MDPYVLLALAVYWSSVALVAFTYLGYPAIARVRAYLYGRPVRRAADAGDGSSPPSVSVVLAAYNERGAITRRLHEFTAAIAADNLVGEVVVVSDGSTDGTADMVRQFAARPGAVPVRLIELRRNGGKAAAITAGCRAAQYEVVVLADTRQTWAPDALARLLENFADPEVGAVSGELEVQAASGVVGGVGLYWRFEKWLRRQEAEVHSTVGLTGAICAARRRLVRPIPAGTILDDVYWPLGVAMQNYRVVFDGRARAFDRLPPAVTAEFRRKVRTLSGNFQLVARLPEALLPWRNPVWFPLIAHKLLRLVVPWAWGAALVASAVVGGPVYGALFAAQAAVTLAGLAGLVPAVAARSRLASAAGSFLVLNAAAWYAFWVWAGGRASRSWTKTVYEAHPPAEPVAAVSLAGASR